MLSDGMVEGDWAQEMLLKYNTELNSRIEGVKAQDTVLSDKLRSEERTNHTLSNLMAHKLKYLNIDQTKLQQALAVLDEDHVFVERESQQNLIDTIFLIKKMLSNKSHMAGIGIPPLDSDVEKVVLLDTSFITSQLSSQSGS